MPDRAGEDLMDAANALGDNDPVVAPSLSDRDREILDFERQWWKYAGAKETAVREKFDMSSTRYYQVLNALIDRPEAIEADPLLVRRLRRLRSARQRQRSARRLGFEV
jgi:Protein of unknown function (DUF3263)